jgi:hypothetical protein
MPEMMEMPTHEVAMGTTEVWAMPSKVRDMATDVTTEMTTEMTAEVTATTVTAAAVTATEVTAATARKSVGSSRQTAKRENCCQRKS